MLILNQLIGFGAVTEEGGYRYYRLTTPKINGASAQWNHREITLKDGGGTNRASGITATSNDDPPTVGTTANLTDGVITAGNKYIPAGLSDGSGNLSPALTLDFDLGAQYDITTYEICPDDAASGSIQDCTLKASNTGAFGGEEVTLDTQTGLTTGWTTGALRSFSVP